MRQVLRFVRCGEWIVTGGALIRNPRSYQTYEHGNRVRNTKLGIDTGDADDLFDVLLEKESCSTWNAESKLRHDMISSPRWLFSLWLRNVFLPSDLFALHSLFVGKCLSGIIIAADADWRSFFSDGFWKVWKESRAQKGTRAGEGCILGILGPTRSLGV